MSPLRARVAATLLALGASACDGARAPAPLGELAIMDVGAAPGATVPNLASDGEGHLVLSWLEAVSETPVANGAAPRAAHRLRFARLDEGRWSAPRTIAEGADVLANWADFPAVVPMGDARLAAWWPRRNPAAGPKGFAYDAMVTTSADGGATWTSPVALHTDRSTTEHGFVSFVPVGPRGDSIGAVWLDGRDYARRVEEPSEHRMQVAVATLADGGAAPADERMLDTMACSCCRTSHTRTRRGVVLAYRDREPGEVRDIAVARYENGAWSLPTTVHRDGWVYPGCPVNGAVVAAHGDTVAVAWFTAPDEQARVNLAFSTDGGRTFAAPTRVDDGSPSGRAAVVVDATGAATVVWIERVSLRARLPWRTAEQQAKGAAGGAELRARRVSLDGTAGPARTLVASTEGRSSGFPQLAALGDTVYMAWTVPDAGGGPSRVQLARTTMRGLEP